MENKRIINLAGMLLIAIALFVAAVSATVAAVPNVREDPNTFSNYDYVRETHMVFDWEIDVEAETIQASNTIKFIVFDTFVTEVVLDSWDLKNISDTCTYINSSSKVETVVPCSVQRGDAPNQGDKLVVDISQFEPNFKPGDLFSLRLQYNVGTTSKALRWFKRSETTDEELPEVYSFSQSIYARSFIPCQDTPDVKFSWEGKVKIKPKMPFYMSGDEISVDNSDPNFAIYEYQLDIPTASYEISIAAGNYEEKYIPDGVNKIKVIGFQDDVNAAAVYFKDAEKYFFAIEEYVDFKYNYPELWIILVHESFPLNSLESPCLVFFSSSLIQSDNSTLNDPLGKLALIHSFINIYFGGLVTHRDWQNEFLTHGLATYIERELTRTFFGDELYREVCTVAVDYYNQTYEQYKNVDKADPSLLTLEPIATENTNPLHALNPIIYEKGFMLFQWIEWNIGNDTMVGMLRRWLDQEKEESVNQLDFKEFMEEYLEEKFFEPKSILDDIDYDTWVNSPDFIDSQILYYFNGLWHTKSKDEAIEMAHEIIELGGVGLPKDYMLVYSWDANKMGIFFDYFLSERGDLTRNPKAAKILKLLDKVYFGFTQYTELVQTAFLVVAVQTVYYPQVKDRVEKILSSTGNLEILLPLYEALLNSNQDLEADKIYMSHEPYYHEAARFEIKRVLKLI